MQQILQSILQNSGRQLIIIICLISFSGQSAKAQTYIKSSLLGTAATNINDMTLLADGNVAVVGNSGDTTFIMKINTNGDTLWTKRYLFSTDVTFQKVKQAPSGAIIVMADDEGSSGYVGLYNFSNTGTLSQSFNYDESDRIDLADLAISSGGTITVVGKVNRFFSGGVTTRSWSNAYRASIPSSFTSFYSFTNHTETSNYSNPGGIPTANEYSAFTKIAENGSTLCYTGNRTSTNLFYIGSTVYSLAPVQILNLGTTVYSVETTGSVIILRKFTSGGAHVWSKYLSSTSACVVNSIAYNSASKQIILAGGNSIFLADSSGATVKRYVYGGISNISKVIYNDNGYQGIGTSSSQKVLFRTDNAMDISCAGGVTQSDLTVSAWSAPSTQSNVSTNSISPASRTFSYNTPINGKINFSVQCFTGCTPPVTPTNTTSAANLSICSGNTTVLSASTTSGGSLRWYAGSSGGPVLSTGANYTTPVLSSDAIYYVEDYACGTNSSRTAVNVTVTTTPGVTNTIASSRCGTGTVGLSATASSGTLSWYDVSSGGSSLGTGTNFTTPSVSTTTPYYVEASENGCTSARSTVNATVNSIPSITGTTGGGRCGTGTVSLSATASAGTLSWYDVSSGGSSLGTGTNFTTPSVSATTPYYVEASDNGCTSTRATVNATVNNVSISTANSASRCGTGTVNLSATASAGTLNWYDMSSGGSSLGTGTNFTTPSISATTPYYVDATDNGCTSARTMVTATVNTSIPTITGTTNGSRCDAGTINLSATASSGTLSWYDVSSGGSSLGTGTNFTTPSISATTPYYVEANNGCASTRSTVTATINTTPSVTSTAGGTRCGTGTVGLTAAATNGTLSWYDAPSAGTLLGTGTNFTTPSISSTTPYYVEAGVGGCNSSRTLVNAVVNTCTSVMGIESNQGFGLYPNPAKQSLIVEMNQTGNYTIQIFDVLGNLVYQNTSGEPMVTIDINNQLSGIYFVNIVNSTGQRWNKSFIKE